MRHKPVTKMRQFNLLLLILLFGLLSCRQAEDSVDGLPFQNTHNERWGLVATDGRILAADTTFSQPPSVVVNDMFSLPDGKGFYKLYHIHCPSQPVSPRRFARIGHFFEKVTLAQETPDSPILIIDCNGRNVASTNQYPQYDIVLAHNFSEGRALIATREGKYGYIDTKGKMVIPPLYDHAYDFSNGVAVVGLTNKEGENGYQVIDRRGNVLFGIQLSNSLLDSQFSHGLLMYKELGTGHCCYLDKEGLPLIYLSENVRETYRFDHEMAVFQTTTGTGIIDLKGSVLIPANYENAMIAGKGKVCLQTNGKWAIAEPNEKLLCEFEYDRIGTFYDSGLAVAQKQGTYLLIDHKGNILENRTYSMIVEDETARQKKPQIFVRRSRITQPNDNEQENGQIKRSEAPTTTVRQKQPPKNTVSSTREEPATPQSVMHTTDWKEISKQSPFFAEASKIVNGKLSEPDAKNRRMILNYVEHLRTSYTTKDIYFLEQLFSENALIVVGKVIRTAPNKETGYLPPAQVEYNVKSKREYLDRLKQVFKANKNIDLKFSDFHIMRHPTVPGLYGVSLRQGYTSDLYSDDGYLFLLWDFRDETAPKIHVRTWQPGMIDERTPLPEESVFNIRNFNLQ